MSFKIIEPYNVNKRITVINSDIVPCCENGHGECSSVWIDSDGSVWCGDNCEPDNDAPYVFWYDLKNDCKFDFEERKKVIYTRTRHGTKKERLMVAALAREHRKEVLKTYHSWCGTLKFRYRDGKRYIRYEHYQLLKSMLKED
jgi:hypothetical protein